MQSKDSININFGQDANYYQTQLRLLQGPELMREVGFKFDQWVDVAWYQKMLPSMP